MSSALKRFQELLYDRKVEYETKRGALGNRNPEQERAFLAPHLRGYRRVLVNGDAALPGAVSIDALLQPLFTGTAASRTLALA